MDTFFDCVPALIRRDRRDGRDVRTWLGLAVEGASALASLDADRRGGGGPWRQRRRGSSAVVDLYVLTVSCQPSTWRAFKLSNSEIPSPHPAGCVGAERERNIKQEIGTTGIPRNMDAPGWWWLLWPGSSLHERGTAFEHVYLYQAMEAIQTAPAFRSAAENLRPIRVAIMDSGFAPTRLDQFTVNSGCVDQPQGREPVVSGLPIFTEEQLEPSAIGAATATWPD